MATIKESRPGQSVRIELGGSYAQPGASVHATWTGQSTRQLGWTGERNAGQPVYSAFDYNQSQVEIGNRFRQMVGDALDEALRDPFSATSIIMQDAPGATDIVRNRLCMQLFTMNYED